MIKPANMRIVALLGISSVVHAGALLAYGYLTASEPEVAVSGGQVQLQLLASPVANAEIAPLAEPAIQTAVATAEIDPAVSRVVVSASKQAAFAVVAIDDPVAPSNSVSRSVVSDHLSNLPPVQSSQRPQSSAVVVDQSVSEAATLKDSVAAVERAVDSASTRIKAMTGATQNVVIDSPATEPLMLAALAEAVPVSELELASVEPSTGFGEAMYGDQQHAQLQRQAGQQLLQALEDYFRYPLKARRKGWQGEVVLTVQLSELGEVGEVQLSHSSGFKALDRAALRSMRKVEAVELLALKGGLSVEVPVSYRLLN